MKAKKKHCPQCWTEHEIEIKACTTCGKKLTKPSSAKQTTEASSAVESNQAVAQATVEMTADPKERIRANLEAAHTSLVKTKKTQPVSSNYKPAPSIFQQIFRPEENETGPEPKLFLVNQSALIRIWSFLIDALLIGIFCVFWPLWLYKVSQYQVEWYGQVAIAFTFAWFYTALLTRSHYRGTLGQCVAGIMVVDSQDKKLTFIKASLRFFLFVFSFASVLGVLWIVFTKTHRGWHDILSRTRVVKAVWMVESEEGELVDYESRKRKWFSMLR